MGIHITIYSKGNRNAHTICTHMRFFHLPKEKEVEEKRIKTNNRHLCRYQIFLVIPLFSVLNPFNDKNAKADGSKCSCTEKPTILPPDDLTVRAMHHEKVIVLCKHQCVTLDAIYRQKCYAD
jgi:hypothetical protein